MNTNLKYNHLRPIIDESQPQFYMETYGCQMNVSDSEVVVAILQKEGYRITENIQKADLILINTCSIRDNAEQRIWKRLELFQKYKRQKSSLRVGLLGCMAERLKDALLENKAVDFVVGPDAYRDLPLLLNTTETGQKGINVLLSQDETYADISPVRLDKNGVVAFVSITRGCNNMCAFCVVPYTRGAERSRNPETIVNEVQALSDSGYKEVCLLGQNVDSYCWTDTDKRSSKVSFSQLLEMVALVDSTMRVRFSTSHPKDMSDEVLYTMAMYDNICSSIHLPVQSGSNSVLEMMNRKYTKEVYLARIQKIREIIPNCSISTDIITGFCGESEADHQETLALMREVDYDLAYMYKYSERPNTKAARHYKDDVSEDDKSRRLTEVIDLQHELSRISFSKEIGKEVEVLVEDYSKRSADDLVGRTPQNKRVIFPKGKYQIGDYVKVLIESCTNATLKGRAVTE